MEALCVTFTSGAVGVTKSRSPSCMMPPAVVVYQSSSFSVSHWDLRFERVLESLSSLSTSMNNVKAGSVAFRTLSKIHLSN